jgi:gliding motility-associated-like protein
LGSILIPFHLHAQLNAGKDDTINPGVPVTLTATFGEIGKGIFIDDDGVEGPFPIGFNFSFFGNVYNQFYVGANGWVGFSPNVNSSGSRQAFAVPNSADYNPKNCILGPWQDMLPFNSGGPYIFYLTTGTAPARSLVVMWCQTPMYSNPPECNDSLMTFQIILHEGSNIIENQIYHKPSCSIWYDNKATLGVQNSNGMKGYAVPGRNATSWTATQEGWTYTPTSLDSFRIAPMAYHLEPITPGNKISFRWYHGTDLISEEQSVTVAPNETSTYWAVATICSGQEYRDTVAIHVIPYIPNAFTPNGDGKNDVFRIFGVQPENITKFNFQVFNRWGQLVFSTTDILEGWDGNCNGKKCAPEVYTWIIYYEDSNKTKVSNKGMVTLIR